MLLHEHEKDNFLKKNEGENGKFEGIIIALVFH
jgi:hypothetical protein